MMRNYYAVIMAGGGGTRLWPISRKDHPKQFLKIKGERSLFQIAIDRLGGLFDFDHIYVVTVAAQVDALQREVPEIPVENYLIEPMPRGTASVVGLAAMWLQAKDPQAVMAVLTADHLIENISLFHELLTSAEAISRENYLVTLGIDPSFPSTGYGYIQAGEPLQGGKGSIVKKFVEKPDEETARRYLQSGNYFWNSGMFIWQAGSILAEFQRQMPALYQALTVIGGSIGSSTYSSVLGRIWQDIVPQTIDYGIMEHAERVVVLPAKGLGWSDVGSWDSLFEFLDVDQNGNTISTDKVVNIDSKNTLFFSEDNNRIIALVDIDDLVIIESGKALLICRKGQTQKIKQVVEQLKKQNMEKYL
jgi:mannose-1-phosphate guanylyltransferase